LRSNLFNFLQRLPGLRPALLATRAIVHLSKLEVSPGKGITQLLQAAR
jgi:hypothetical protein